MSDVEHTEADLLRDLSAIEAYCEQARSAQADGDATRTAAALYMISVLSTRWTGAGLNSEHDGGENSNGTPRADYG